MVKPEFFDSESLGACSIEARLAFIGLWVNGDDYGNVKAQASRLKLKIFPYDNMSDAEFVGYLAELEEVGCIKGYVVDEERYITCPNFVTYQTVRKPSKSSIPTPPKELEKQRRTTVIRLWKTSLESVENNTSTSLVRHQYATSDVKERKKERRNRDITNISIPKEVGAASGADVENSTPLAAQCPECSNQLTATGMREPEAWYCDTCNQFIANPKRG